MKNLILTTLTVIAFAVPLTAAAIVGMDKEAERQEAITNYNCEHFGPSMKAGACDAYYENQIATNPFQLKEARR